MSIESKVKATLKSAELSFELGIINPTRYGPLIHANVPDYVEILLRVYVDENGLTLTRDNFHNLSDAVEAHLPVPHKTDYQPLGKYFKDIRAAFRNPLHHHDRVQGYVIEQREALLCLLRFDEVINAIFPSVVPNAFDDLNYPCYVRYLQIEYEESLGKGDHRLYQAVMSYLQNLERSDDFRCPPDFDASRLVSIRRLFRMDEDRFIRNVLKFRPQLVETILDIFEITQSEMTPRQIRNQMNGLNVMPGVRDDEIQACLQYIEGKEHPGRGVIAIFDQKYYLSPI